MIDIDISDDSDEENSHEKILIKKVKYVIFIKKEEKYKKLF